MTDVPARLYGLRDRGRVAEGWLADLVVFDPARSAREPAASRATTCPAALERLYAESTGVEHVLVAGREVVRGGELTGELAGAVLRSGRDTDTVTLSLTCVALAHQKRVCRQAVAAPSMTNVVPEIVAASSDAR